MPAALGNLCPNRRPNKGFPRLLGFGQISLVRLLRVLSGLEVAITARTPHTPDCASVSFRETDRSSHRT